jgi:hypothetical protein
MMKFLTTAGPTARRVGVGVFGALVLCTGVGPQGAWGATQTFETPGKYSFTVPAGVTSLYVAAVGAAGGSCFAGPGGRGASASAIVPVTPGQQLFVGVGGAGGSGGVGGTGQRVCPTWTGGAAGVNGGGAGGSIPFAGNALGGAGGGGASAVGPGDATAPVFSSLMVVAGGGGGGTYNQAGGDSGSAGSPGLGNGDSQGGAGTLLSGGLGGLKGSTNSTPGSNGGALAGGDGGNGDSAGASKGAGGGGGGYYGGGGGGGSGPGGYAGSGGGGSSFIASAATFVIAPAVSSSAAGVTLVAPAPDPPTATVASPSSGSTQALGQSVPTSFSCTEGERGFGVVSCTDSTGTNTTAGGTGLLDTSTVGAHTYTVTATSATGLTGAKTINYTVQAAPTATIASPASGGAYVVGQSVPTSFSCTEGAGSPGLASCADSTGTNTTAGGTGLLDTSAVGAHTYTVTARSTSGLIGTASISYTVTDPPLGETSPLGAVPKTPAVRRLKIAPSSFLAASSGPVTAATRKGRVGARMRYSLTVPGKVTFTVKRRKGTRYVTVGTFTRTAKKAGTVAFVYRGRIGNRRLTRGTYRMNARLRTATGERSATVRATFKILRG